MAITPGSFNPHLATLPRPGQEPGKTPAPKESKEGGKPLGGQQKAATTPASTSAPTSAPVDGELSLGDELGQMKQDLGELQGGGKAPADPALYEKTLKDGFATKQVASARPVQQVNAVGDSRFQGRTAEHQDAVSLEKLRSPVKARSESATPEDLALLDMSEEQLGEKVDLTKLT